MNFTSTDPIVQMTIHTDPGRLERAGVSDFQVAGVVGVTMSGREVDLTDRIRDKDAFSSGQEVAISSGINPNGVDIRFV